MNILTAEHITKTYSERVLLDDVAFSLQNGEKVGIVGANGMGKSTLLRILAGAEEADRGSIVVGNDIKIGYLPQSAEFESHDTVLSATLKGRMSAAGIFADRYAAVIPEDFEKESEAKSMLGKLGFQNLDQPVRELSGGQKKRVALAHVLLQPNDLLILDEPTNHLDSEMSGWLEDYLIRFRGTLVMVTHDRYFLDRVSGRIVEVDRGEVYSYLGNYSAYVALKEERLDIAKASERKRQSILRTELKWLARGARARSTKQKAHIRRIEDLQNVMLKEETGIAEMTSVASRMGRKTLEAKGISKSFGGRRVISDYSYLFLKGDRIGIIGPNGCGKSTLLNILTGHILPDWGEIEVGQTIKIGYFSQENEFMDESLKAIEYIRDVAEYIQMPDGKLTASALMEQFLFDGNAQWTLIGKLSGGEKRRLYLLHILMGAPNILVLDEPTNDLDIQTLTILEDYLDHFQGIVITVSHDRYFLDRTVNRIFAFEGDGHILQYEGNYSDYLAMTAVRAVTQGESGNVSGVQEEKKKQTKPRRGVRLKFTYREEQEFAHIDEEIAAIEARVAALNDEMAAAATQYTKLNELMEEKQKAESLLEKKIDRWVYLNDLSERIQAEKE